MKKILSVIFFILTISSVIGCDGNKMTSSNNESSGVSQSASDELNLNELNLKKWQVTYTEFLIDLYKNSKYEEDNDCLFYKTPHEMYQFSLKDLDNDGIPELIITKRGVELIVYTFDNKLINTGNRYFGTGTIRYLFSDNPSYSGIFTFHLGGGMNHYGYVIIKENEFVYEELWDEDYSGITSRLGMDREKIKEYSNDRRLINESKKVYEKNNDLPFQDVMNTGTQANTREPSPCVAVSQLYDVRR